MAGMRAAVLLAALLACASTPTRVRACVYLFGDVPVSDCGGLERSNQ